MLLNVEVKQIDFLLLLGFGKELGMTMRFLEEKEFLADLQSLSNSIIPEIEQKNYYTNTGII
jgi:hypothetical protein